MIKKTNKNKYSILKNILFIFVCLFLFFYSYNPVKAVGESCTTFQDCPANYMCINTSMTSRGCYPKIGGGCNQNSDCAKIEKELGISGAFCRSGDFVEGYNGVCFSNTNTTSTTSSTKEFKKTADLNPLGNLKIEIPGVKELADKYPIRCNTIGETENCEIPWIAIYIYAIYNYMLAIGGVLAVVTIMIGGVIWLVSAGNASRIATAKSWITGSLTGLLILLTSYVLLYQINPNLVDTVYIELRTVTPLADADITVIGGKSPYMEGCLAAKKGDYSICKAYGNAEPSGLTAYKGKRINIDVLKKYEAAMECVKQKNGKYLFYINEAWRSAATQISYTERKLPAAVPCCSNHGSGQAMDLSRLDGVKMSWSYNESSGLKECMNAQGLYANLTSGKYNEPWHWSPTGR